MLCIELGVDGSLKDWVNQKGRLQASWAEDKMGANLAKHGQEIEHGLLLLEGIRGGEK